MTAAWQGCPPYAEDDNEKGRTGGRTPTGALGRATAPPPATARREQQSFGDRVPGRQHGTIDQSVDSETRPHGPELDAYGS